MKPVLLVLSFLALSVPALADTRSTDGDKTTKERNTSPSASQKQEEESAEAHSQPDSTPSPKAAKPKSKSKAAKKPSASAGSSRPALDESQELAFKKHDLDGDGEISKAEAAGSDLISHFERFDRNKDGKLNRAEYARALSAAAKKHQASRQ